MQSILFSSTISLSVPVNVWFWVCCQWKFLPTGTFFIVKLGLSWVLSGVKVSSR